MRRIYVMGTGYVGLVSGACLADFGNAVVAVRLGFEYVSVGRVSRSSGETDDTSSWMIPGRFSPIRT
ncbi:MAG: hypothetical protein VX528_15355 [Candidatus Latescibacterota bacterium]|nr:hypothetical protein [Candidatus Latescibacterota bacterium]